MNDTLPSKKFSFSTRLFCQAVMSSVAAMTAGESPGILDAQHLAERLGMNVQMVRKYAREGRIPSFRPGKAYGFSGDDVVAELCRHPVSWIHR